MVVQLLVAMLGLGVSTCRPGAAVRPCHLELWDRAFSRRLLTADELDPLLRRLGVRADAVREEGLVGGLSKALHQYMMHVTAHFKIPLPPALLHKLKGVLLEVAEPQDGAAAAIEQLIQDLEAFLLQGRH